MAKKAEPFFPYRQEPRFIASGSPEILCNEQHLRMRKMLEEVQLPFVPQVRKQPVQNPICSSSLRGTK
jgi:hypothetical protein